MQNHSKEFNAEAFSKEATNITLYERVMEMVDNFGEVQSPDILPMWRDFYDRMISEKGKGNKRKSSDFTESFNGFRYRCNLSNCHEGWVIAMRRLLQGVPSFSKDLKIDYNIIKPLLKGAGLTLFAGAMNSGKSTTMFAALENMDRRERGLLGTCEDPIEYLFQGGGVIQREVGEHVESFEQAIRDFVRQNRKTIMVSEIRDPETANAAVLAASTGHSVIGTIHSDGAPDTYTRLLALVDPRYARLLPVTLRGVFWQHLLRFSDRTRDPLPVIESIEVTTGVRQILQGGPESIPLLANEMRRQGRKSMAETAMALVSQGKATREEVREFTERRGRINDI
ncbi:ATPase, T2SS/T4P/T4SS family [Pseudomonas sp. NY15437]|uniref:ATPase, T2SS/T4P/T4SS family n=1 Tax=Pseudomonas sp. NY15437 TaxID=3400360 RepID=UPI003A83B1D7|nr:Flp pilus assembly complex ATPase component [Pseudomonas aeruginosa]